ncbi:ATP-dependent zinc metalloprotease FtsH [Planctomycetales bacterium 10988]|nr:ATP-dependent zinc metalloprotease FtsH [Planctomycetales bacterium 10988]
MDPSSDKDKQDRKLTPDEKARQGETPEPSPSGRGLFSPQFILLFIIVGFVLSMLYWPNTTPRSTISYSFFIDQVKEGNVSQITFDDSIILGEFAPSKEPPFDPDTLPKEGASEEEAATPQKEPQRLLQKFRVVRPPVDDEELMPLLREKNVLQTAEVPADGSGLILLSLIVTVVLSVLILLAFYVMMRRARDQMGGGGFLGNFSRSPARRYEPDKQRVMFDDVAGLETVKKELQEVVEFLKSPAKFQRLGGVIPKGTLLNGPPGTGKTLLAKAIAGEADVPFFSINGSEFIQMFVGVGASRVRDLFRTAKENAPCIVFIDEIDAVGRIRGAGFGGGHDEREQTLNQILSEMDGFSPSESVIVIAATNRPDVLDPALLRPGRFDRHITVDRPSMKARKELFVVHSRKVPLGDDVDLDRLAAGTIGMTGADIRNLVNEAALWATRQNRDHVEQDDFEYARDKVLMGPQRDEVLSGHEKEMTAYHEAGHALLAWLEPGADRLHKVSIIPRGRALGVTHLLPQEDRLNVSENDLKARLVYLLGGRAAERLVYDEISAGAENDLKQATAIARRMVTHWGMSERLGPVAYRQQEDHPFLGKEITEQRLFSEHTAQVIDEEVARILHGAEDRAETILRENRDKLEMVTEKLIEKETLDDEEITELIGPAKTADKPTLRNGEALKASSSKTQENGSQDSEEDTKPVSESESDEEKSDESNGDASDTEQDSSVKAEE